MTTPNNCFQCVNLIYTTASEHPYKCTKAGQRLAITDNYDLSDILGIPKWCPLRQKEAVK